MPECLRPSGFPIDVPVIVELLDATAKAEETRFGWQMVYQLADGRAMYLPPDASKALDELGPAAGETIAITRRQVKRGTRRLVEFQFARLDPANSELPESDEHPVGDGVDRMVPAATPQVSPNEHPPNHITASPCLGTPVLDARSPDEILKGNVTPITHAKTEPPTDTERLLAASIQKAVDEKNGTVPVNGHAAAMPVNGTPVNGNGKTPKPEATAEEILAVAKNTPMAQALRKAVASAFLAEEFARKLNYALRFSSTDIEAMAVTILIGEQRNGRY
jgi:hypothetical protein